MAIEKIMKLPLLPGMMAIVGLVFSLAPLFAEVEKNEDGTYTISGTWTYWPERDIVTPSGKNDFGEFKTILFKLAGNEFAGMKELKKTPAVFKVKARVSGEGTDKNLVVEEVLEKVGKANPGETTSPAK